MSDNLKFRPQFNDKIKLKGERNMRTLAEIKAEAVKVLTAKRNAERKIVKCRERLVELREEEIEAIKKQVKEEEK